MKKLPFIIGIPLLVLLIVVGVALYLKLNGGLPELQNTVTRQYPSIFSKGDKPDTNYSSLDAGTESVTQLEADLQTTVDDGGQGEFMDVVKEESKL